MSMSPFSGVRILDLTYWLGRYATRLFADLGADVIRIEPPGGLPDRKRPSDLTNQPDHQFAFFNASKSSVILDPKTKQGREQFNALLAGATIVFIERGAAFFDEIASIRAANPAAVITLVSPYGLGGPLSDAPASDLTLQAAGGIAWLSGRVGEPPLILPFGQSAMITSVYAAVATALALADSERTGKGHLIDVSAQECIAHSLQNAVQVYDLERIVSVRGGENTRDASEDMFACKDGFVFLSAAPMLASAWKSLVAWMHEISHPSAEEFSKTRWLEIPWRQTKEAKDIFRVKFEAFAADKTREELRQNAIKRRLVLAPVARIADVLGDKQLAFTGFFQQLSDPGTERAITLPGPPFRMSENVWSVRPAPALGGETRHAAAKAPA